MINTGMVNMMNDWRIVSVLLREWVVMNDWRIVSVQSGD